IQARPPPSRPATPRTQTSALKRTGASARPATAARDLWAHQPVTVEAITSELSEGSRATVVSACGTGKQITPIPARRLPGTVEPTRQVPTHTSAHPGAVRPTPPHTPKGTRQPYFPDRADQSRRMTGQKPISSRERAKRDRCPTRSASCPPTPTTYTPPG